MAPGMEQSLEEAANSYASLRLRLVEKQKERMSRAERVAHSHASEHAGNIPSP